MKTYREALRTESFVLSSDLPLSPTTTVADIEKALRNFAPLVSAVQVIDDRDAVGHMSPLTAASIVLRNDMDAVVHLTCRDRNRVALQADLVGAAALGVTSLILQRGEKLSKKGALRGKGVFDTSETRLTEMARRVGEESGLVSEPGFLLGACVTVFGAGEGWQAKRIHESINAGTRLLMSQPCLNVQLLRHYMARVVAQKITHRASFVVDVPLLGTAEEARTYKSNNPAALIPDATIADIAASADPRAAGIDACVRMVNELKDVPGVAGANIRCTTDVEAAQSAAAAVRSI
tara:strand:+ start:280 stop:1155 length:876 start_codon:yes stop_codon:yes gene_type:complete